MFSFTFLAKKEAEWIFIQQVASSWKKNIFLDASLLESTLNLFSC